jgi:hypothetical protein
MLPLRSTGNIVRRLANNGRFFYSQFNVHGKKGSDDPESINASRDEYSKSGGDDAVAAQESSYSAQQTDPNSHMEAAAKGNKINPLEVSPANRDTSIYISEKDWHPESGVPKTTTSVRVSPKKHFEKGGDREKEIQKITVQTTKEADRRPTHAGRKST